MVYKIVSSETLTVTHHCSSQTVKPGQVCYAWPGLTAIFGLVHCWTADF